MQFGFSETSPWSRDPANSRGPLGKTFFSQRFAEIERSNVTNCVFGRKTCFGKTNTFFSQSRVRCWPDIGRFGEHLSEVGRFKRIHPANRAARSKLIVGLKIRQNGNCSAS